MALTVQSLLELDSTKVQQTVELIGQLLQESAPEIDLRRGVLHDLLVYYSGVLATATQENIDRVRRSSSLLEINNDPTLADDTVVDAVLSNYLITRRQGTNATGTITVVVDSLESVTVPTGSVFEANGKSFKTNKPYTAVTSSANVTSDSDRILTKRTDGTYFFNIEVEAVETGTDSLLKKDTALVAKTGILNYVKSYVTSDFTGAIDTETNTELLARLQEGIAAKTLSSRVSIAAVIKENFSNVTDLSIIGFGDSEMVRDRHSIFPVSYGGRVDIYVRTQNEPTTYSTTLDCALISKDSDGVGTWQVSISRNIFPGFYYVKAITPLDDTFVGSFDFTEEIYGYDTTNIAGELTPDIVSADEATFSRYSTVTIRFKDTFTNATSLTLGTIAQYNIVLVGMQNISDIQTLVGSRQVRNYAGDVLVRAAVPCFVSVAFTIQGKPGTKIPDLSAIKVAVVKEINTSGFCGRLHSSSLANVIHDYLSENTALSSIDMYGQIKNPDGTITTLRSTEALVIDDTLNPMVTARTVNFITNTDDIIISVQTVNIPEI